MFLRSNESSGEETESLHSGSSGPSESSSLPSTYDENMDDEESEERSSRISHVYVSMSETYSDRPICYGFDSSSCEMGEKITAEIKKSCEPDEKGTSRGSFHAYLMDSLLRIAFYDSEDETTMNKEEKKEWAITCMELFGERLNSENVGDWFWINPCEVCEYDKVAVVFVKCGAYGV